jgi:hypothetical protein
MARAGIDTSWSKRKPSDSTVREFNVLCGFDVAEGRWEIGDPLSDKDIAPETIERLLEDGDIEVIDGDS